MISFNCNSWGLVIVLWGIYDCVSDSQFKRGVRFRFGSRVFRLWNPDGNALLVDGEVSGG